MAAAASPRAGAAADAAARGLRRDVRLSGRLYDQPLPDPTSLDQPVTNPAKSAR